ncbi:hypothetical protein [Aliarcobacter cryaerophilus]|uniref:hypothetical protein n=1 Tax=Aliarcobacter cryaerophilus TaxID=28198 RepID=UPI00112F64E5|nr:hypothetical protein [Aliarcobacter cryaerophilus]
MEKNNYLKDEGNALRVQKHQISNSENKLTEIDNILNILENEQKNSSKSLDSMIASMTNLLESTGVDYESMDIEEELVHINTKLNIDVNSSNVKIVSEIEGIKYKEELDWNEYIDYVYEYGKKHNINLEEDPFKHIMSVSQQIELQKRIKEEFTLKNANCDKYDYMIAGTCGVITGLIDILFVGSPTDSKLGGMVDSQANKITEKFASFLGWDKEKAAEKGKNTTASAIGYLEKKFKINYDHATTHSTGGAVENLSLKNHHLKSLGHSPDLIGLFFSVLNQFTNTSSFISNGQLITIDTETFELQGGNLIAKIFCGIANWFGHIMSDWTGSSGTVGQGGRGTGVPIPFYNLFQILNVGEFGQHKQTFATITTKVFENGYDARHGIAMAIPVLINELLIRFMYTMKARFYHNKKWIDSVPKGSVPELRRMLLVGHGVLCLIDGADAYVRSGAGADMVELLSRTNLIAWVRFGHLAYKEVYAWYNAGHIDADAVDEYIDRDLRRMLN